LVMPSRSSMEKVFCRYENAIVSPAILLTFSGPFASVISPIFPISHNLR